MSDISVLLLAGLGIAVAAVVLSRLVARLVDRWRRRSRARHAMRGEIRARRLLQRHGYQVLEEQVRHEYYYSCDGQRERAGLRADYLVRRSGKRYVAEVKTGSLVVSLAHAATRRQLLEYQFAFQTDGVLLVDVDAEHLREIRF